MCRFHGLHLCHFQVCARLFMHVIGTEGFVFNSFVTENVLGVVLFSRTVNFDIVKYLYDFL